MEVEEEKGVLWKKFDERGRCLLFLLDLSLEHRCDRIFCTRYCMIIHIHLKGISYTVPSEARSTAENVAEARTAHMKSNSRPHAPLWTPPIHFS